MGRTGEETVISNHYFVCTIYFSNDSDVFQKKYKTHRSPATGGISFGSGAAAATGAMRGGGNGGSAVGKGKVARENSSGFSSHRVQLIVA